MASSHIHGARAKVSLYDPLTGKSRIIGIWTSIDLDWAYDVRPSFILGRFSPAALTTVGVEPVNIRASGWRTLDHSFFKEGFITDLANLLNQEYLMLSVEDRDSGKTLARVQGCLPTGSSMSLPSKDLATGTNTYMGLLMSTEDFDGVEPEGPDGATALP